MNILNRNDIVGKKVIAVHTSEWIFEEDGYTFCHYTYITLETGVVFSLGYVDVEKDFPPIIDIAQESYARVAFEACHPQFYIGKEILELIVNEFGYQGILLVDGSIIYWDMIGITIYGPMITSLKDVEWENFVPYWSEHDFCNPITWQSIFS